MRGLDWKCIFDKEKFKVWLRLVIGFEMGMRIKFGKQKGLVGFDLVDLWSLEIEILWLVLLLNSIYSS